MLSTDGYRSGFPPPEVTWNIRDRRYTGPFSWWMWKGSGINVGLICIRLRCGTVCIEPCGGRFANPISHGQIVITKIVATAYSSWLPLAYQRSFSLNRYYTSWWWRCASIMTRMAWRSGFG